MILRSWPTGRWRGKAWLTVPSRAIWTVTWWSGNHCLTMLWSFWSSNVSIGGMRMGLEWQVCPRTPVSGNAFGSRTSIILQHPNDWLCCLGDTASRNVVIQAMRKCENDGNQEAGWVVSGLLLFRKHNLKFQICRLMIKGLRKNVTFSSHRLYRLWHTPGSIHEITCILSMYVMNILSTGTYCIHRIHRIFRQNTEHEHVSTAIIPPVWPSSHTVTRIWMQWTKVLHREYNTTQHATRLESLFSPIYRSGHPENYLFTLSKLFFSGWKHPKTCILFWKQNHWTRKTIDVGSLERDLLHNIITQRLYWRQVQEYRVRTFKFILEIFRNGITHSNMMLWSDALIWC